MHKSKNGLQWTETEQALPLPFPPAALDPVLGLTLKLSDLVNALDQETLQVRGLPAGNYELSIDGRKIETFSSEQLNAGVNLATLDTPMLAQARLVGYDTEKTNDLESAHFDIIYKSLTAESSPVAKALADALPAAVARQRADAQPVPHHFQIERQISTANE